MDAFAGTGFDQDFDGGLIQVAQGVVDLHHLVRAEQGSTAAWVLWLATQAVFAQRDGKRVITEKTWARYLQMILDGNWYEVLCLLANKAHYWSQPPSVALAA